MAVSQIPRRVRLITGAGAIHAFLLGLVEAGLMKQYQQGKAYVFVARPDLAERLRR